MAFSGSDDPADLERAGDDLFWAGDFDGTLAALELAYALYRERGNERRAGYIAVHLADFHAWQGNPAVAMGWYQTAVGHLQDAPDCEEKAWLLVLQATGVYYMRGDVDGAIALCAEAHRIGSAVGSRDMETIGRSYWGYFVARRGDVAEGMALLDEAMATAVSVELDRYAAAIAFCHMLSTCQVVGDFGRAAQWIEQSKRRTYGGEPMGLPGDCRVHRAGMLRMQGLWEEALREADQAAVECDKRDQHPGEAEFEIGMLKLYAGDLAAAEDAFRRAHARGRDPQPGLAWLAMARDDPGAASRGIATSIALANPSNVARAELLSAATEICSEAGDIGAAQRAVAELDAHERKYPVPVVQARAAHARGALHVARHESSEALTALTIALGVWREIGAPYEAARTRFLLSQAYEQAGDADRATLELEAARAEFVRLGAVLDARRTEQLLGTTGPLAGTGLTPREVEVLRLLAIGHTNKAIASELFVSVATIERHVANIYRKIGVRSRVEATRFALDRGVVRSTSTT